MFTTQKRKKLQYLYENYRDYVYWISYNVVHDVDDAEDIVQNSFLKVGRMLDYFETEQEDKTKMLLSAVTKNTAIDYYRKKQKHIEREGSSDPDILDEILDAKQLEDIVIDNYNYEHLMKKIEKLPEKYKEMLVMHYLFDLPVKEIAVQMSLSENNAYTRICRARTLLKESMEKDKEE